MPVLYILAASQVQKRKPNIKRVTDNTISIIGTPKGIRTIIIIGEVSGIIDSQKATGPSGLLITN